MHMAAEQYRVIGAAHGRQEVRRGGTHGHGSHAVHNFSQGKTQRVGLVQSGFKHPGDNLYRAGQAGSRRQDQGEVFRHNLAAFGNLVGNLNRRHFVDFQYDAGGIRLVAVSDLIEQRLPAAQRPRRARTERAEGALALAVGEAPACVLAGQASDHGVAGMDVHVPGPVLVVPRGAQPGGGQPSQADLGNLPAGFDAAVTADARVDEQTPV